MSEEAKTVVVGGKEKVSTEPQVRKLDEKFPDPIALRGTIITHEEIEDTIGHKRTEGRYRSITDRWRKKVFKRLGVVIWGQGEAIGEGFKVLSDREQADFTRSQRTGAHRKTARAHVALQQVNEEKLSPVERMAREHDLMHFARLQLVFSEHRIAPASPRPPEARPQIPAPVN